MNIVHGSLHGANRMLLLMVQAQMISEISLLQATYLIDSEIAPN